MKKKEITPDHPDVYKVIIEILESNGFKDNGDTVDRMDTGCQFSFACLNKYNTVTDFQLDWPYSKE